MSKPYKIGVSLSGGGARGIAHAGILKAFEDHLISPEIISGTSAGSIIGALYAAGMKPAEILTFAEENQLWKAIRFGFPITGLTDLSYLKDQISAHITDDRFEALEKPLHLAVTNLNTGQAEIRHKGPLLDTVLASCSIPLVFKPVEIEGQLYVDGGVLNNLPALCLREQCDILIGVNVMPHIDQANEDLNSMTEIAIRSFELSIWQNTEPQIAHCDYFIQPNALKQFHIFQFSKAKEIYEVGYEEGMKVIPDILKEIL
ncbi:MAG: patatin-like phospholipase family protein [Bacteroidota bacterium]